MTEVLSLYFDVEGPDERSQPSAPSQQLDAHLVMVSGIAGTLAAALSATKDESLSQCAYFLEVEIERLRELLSRCDISLPSSKVDSETSSQTS